MQRCVLGERALNMQALAAAFDCLQACLAIKGGKLKPFFVTDWLIYGNKRLAGLFYPLPRVEFGTKTFIPYYPME